MQAGSVYWHTLMYLYSTHASVTHCRRVSPLGLEGLAILALRKLHRQPYFFRCCALTFPLAVLGNGALHLSLSPVLLW
jgi:hypothetical protein